MPNRKARSKAPVYAVGTSETMIRLGVNYFFVAREMRERLYEARDTFDQMPDGIEKEAFFVNDYSVYLRLWLASLFPVCDGLRKIGFSNEALDTMIRQNMGALRAVAKVALTYVDNNTFTEGATAFLIRDDVNMQSAEELHVAIEEHFNSCFVADGSEMSDRRSQIN